jgi:hypothetical protein
MRLSDEELEQVREAYGHLPIAKELFAHIDFLTAESTMWRTCYEDAGEAAKVTINTLTAENARLTTALRRVDADLSYLWAYTEQVTKNVRDDLPKE